MKPVQYELQGLDVTREERRPWKVTTGTSRMAVKEAERSGRLSARLTCVSVALRAMWNRSQRSPTSDELATEMWELDLLRDGENPEDETKRDWYTLTVRRALSALQAKGAVEKTKNGVRVSAVSGRQCETWRVVERGTGAKNPRNDAGE